MTYAEISGTGLARILTAMLLQSQKFNSFHSSKSYDVCGHFHFPKWSGGKDSFYGFELILLRVTVKMICKSNKTESIFFNCAIIDQE